MTPKASRPHMPGYGIVATKKGLLPWRWAVKRLTKSHNYWLSTARPDGRPHCAGVWGVWFQGKFYFSSGREALKARNLVTQPYCVVCTESARQPVIVEGEAREFAGRIPKALSAAYKKKYKYDLDPAMGPIFQVTPRVAFGLIEGSMVKTATRWQFE